MSKHTVPALREMAQNLRNKAARDLAAAKAEAEDLCAAADELDADAKAKEAAQQQQDIERKSTLHASCLKCGNPIMKDELGWTHPPGNAGLCIDPTPPEARHTVQPMADDVKVAPQQPFTIPCWKCGDPVMKDGDGWRHVRQERTACQAPGPDEHTATRTPGADTVVDGQSGTREVAQ